MSSGLRAFLAGRAGVLVGALAGAFAGVLAVLAGVFVALTTFVVRRERAAVLGGGAVAVRLVLPALVALVALVVAVRRAVVVLALRDVFFAATLVVALRRVERACPRAGCFAVDRVALGMADTRLPG